MKRTEQTLADLNQWSADADKILGIQALHRFGDLEIRFLPLLLGFLMVERQEMILDATGNLDADLP